jgi:hypothetical protein
MRYLKYPPALKWATLLLLSLGAANLSAQTQVEDSSATSPLEVVISHPDTPGSAVSGVVVITITNHSAASILLPRINTPIKGPINGRQIGEILEVTDTEGTPVKYIGDFVDERPVPDNPELSFERVEPSQTISGEIDLALDYNIKAGKDYLVGYTQRFGGDELLDLETSEEHAVRSNTLDVRVENSSA